MRIALLEDDVDQARMIQIWLEAAGHTCRHFETGSAFKQGIRRESFDLLVLDWILPDINGDEVLTWVRENLDWRIPVIFVTVRDAEEDIVYALERGADDYMTKPVKPLEMLARITALGRRAHAQPEQEKVLEFEPFRVDCATRKIVCNGETVEMTQKEFDLAMFLFRNAGRLLSRGHILESVWGRSAAVNTRTVDTHVSRIRNKLHLTPEDTGWRLSAVYQHGYRLERAPVTDSAVSE